VKFIGAATYPNLKEERLGQSSYYVKYPSTMFIDEARGKEGQHGFGLWQIDSINRYISPSGFIEIEPGRRLVEVQTMMKSLIKFAQPYLTVLLHGESRKLKLDTLKV
jgi:hypothetical protein